MKRYNLSANATCIPLLFTIFLALTSVPSWAQSSGRPFSVTISPEHAIAKVGTDVRIKIVLMNISNQEIEVRQVSVEEDYGARVENASTNSPVIETRRGLDLKKRPGLTDTMVRAKRLYLQPGQAFVDYITVSDLYDMHRPGQYTIQLEHEISPEQGGGFAESNIITVTVTE